MSFHMERHRRWEPVAEISRPGEGADATTIPPASDDHAQLTIDDALEDARRARDAGVTAASRNTWTPWRDAAHEFVTSLPAGTELTSDAIVEAVGLPLGSRNATGAFVQGCIRSGLIEWTGQVVQSTRVSRHGAWIKLYRRGA